MRASRRLLSRKGSHATEIATRDGARPGRDETPRVVTQVALYWGDTLVRIEEHPAILVAAAADFGVPDDARWDVRAALPLPEQMRESVWAHFGDLSLRLTRTFAARPCGRIDARDTDGLGMVIGSALLHAAALASLAWTFAAGGGALDPEIGPDQLTEMRGYLARAGGSAGSANGEAAEAAAAADEGAAAGADAPARNEEGSRGSSRGAARSPRSGGAQDVAPGDREALRREASSFGVVALLDRARPVTPGAGFDAPGAGGAGFDAPGAGGARGGAAAAQGAMWGDEIGDAFGVGGLGLSGVGEAGGGRGEGIAIGGVGTVGRAGGAAQGFGYGHCGGCGLSGTHVVKSPSIRCGELDDLQRAGPLERAGSPVAPTGGCTAHVYGRLPPEVVQRVVRQSFGRFRHCYEQGLAKNPALEGRVSVKFVVARDGSVATSADGGSDMKDGDVVACVVRRFADLSFPKPEGGIVTVVYPLVLSTS